MKKISILNSIFLISLLVSGCNQHEESSTKTQFEKQSEKTKATNYKREIKNLENKIKEIDPYHNNIHSNYATFKFVKKISDKSILLKNKNTNQYTSLDVLKKDIDFVKNLKKDDIVEGMTFNKNSNYRTIGDGSKNNPFYSKGNTIDIFPKGNVERYKKITKEKKPLKEQIVKIKEKYKADELIKNTNDYRDIIEYTNNNVDPYDDKAIALESASIRSAKFIKINEIADDSMVEGYDYTKYNGASVLTKVYDKYINLTIDKDLARNLKKGEKFYFLINSVYMNEVFDDDIDKAFNKLGQNDYAASFGHDTFFSSKSEREVDDMAQKELKFLETKVEPKLK